MKGQTHNEVAMRDRAIYRERQQGATAAELCAKYSVTPQLIYRVTKSLPKDPKPPKPPSARDLKMASMHKQGLTLEKIGQQFKLTRERVRQILTKQGIKAVDGGFHINITEQRAQAAKDREARYQIKYGFSQEQMVGYRKRRFTHAYRQQKRNAAERGIEFRLTFKQWVTVWESSGKYEQRGRGIGKYVMSRIKDEGCYEVGNVHIQLSTENNSEARKKAIEEGKKNARVGVYHLTPGAEHAWHARYGRVQLGRFCTEQEAIQARSSFMAERAAARA